MATKIVGKILWTILGVFIVAIIATILFAVYFVSNFGAEPAPYPLYIMEFQGKVERLEVSMEELFQEQSIPVQYKNDHLSDAYVFKTISDHDTITFEFSSYYCIPLRNWANHTVWENCDHTNLILHKIFLNSDLLFYRTNKTKRHKGIEPYIEIFEKEIVANLNINIKDKPNYLWHKHYNQDSSIMFVSVVSEEISDTITEHEFFKRSGNSYGLKQSNKYFGDSIIQFTYDNFGHHIKGKSVILPHEEKIVY